jgi:phospholipase/carboxylesterase
MEFEEHTQLSIFHLTRFPLTYQVGEPQSRYPAILALHGHGSNERDLIELAPLFQENLLWISGRGPHELSPGSYDWYHVEQIGRPNPAYLAAALETLDAFITEVLDNYPIDPQKFFLMGFSQGSMIAMSYALTRPGRVSGIIAQSGYIPGEAGLKVDLAGIKDKPFIITHGLEDPMISIDTGHRTRDTLLSLKARVAYHEFHMGHSISSESIAVIRTWLAGLI